MPNFQALKFPERITWYNLNYAVSTTKNLDIVLNTQKKSLLKSSHTQENILVKFSYPKKSRIGKFETPKNSSIIPVT